MLTLEQGDAAPEDPTAPLHNTAVWPPALQPPAVSINLFMRLPACLPACLPGLPCPCSHLLNRLWGNDLFMQYLQTGEYDWNPLPW
jgi:hypothetical protein